MQIFLRASRSALWEDLRIDGLLDMIDASLWGTVNRTLILSIIIVLRRLLLIGQDVSGECG
jgi:hypothetical protein